MPLKAPAEVTFKPVDCKTNGALVLPIVVVAVPVVLMFVVPVIMAPPLSEAKPAALKVPPKVVAPVPTVRVLAPEIVVLPFKVTVPVPVLKVPAPVIPKLPLPCV